MILHQMIVQGRCKVGYRKKNKETDANEFSMDWVRNPNLDSVWIKELPMLYYSSLDNELI